MICWCPILEVKVVLCRKKKDKKEGAKGLAKAGSAVSLQVRIGIYKKLSKSRKHWIHKVEWTERKTWNRKTFSQSRVVAAPRVPQHSYSMSSLKRFMITYILTILLTTVLLTTVLLIKLLLIKLLLTCSPDQVSWVSGSGTWSTSCLVTVLPRKKWKQVKMIRMNKRKWKLEQIILTEKIIFSENW